MDRDSSGLQKIRVLLAGPRGDDVENDDVDWDNFDSDYYFKKNYNALRWDDRRIIELTGDFFERVAAGRLQQARGRRVKAFRGVDVGSGTNLYPTLAMLPFCYQITLRERGAGNCRWLTAELHGSDGYGESWDPFWTAMSADRPSYKTVAEPRRAIQARAEISRGSVFELPLEYYDIGTMFFVAESITNLPTEFRMAVRRFVRSLKPGAPFAAAFMRDSEGYFVGPHWFPAVAITEGDVRDSLRDLAADVEIHSIDSTTLRSGYQGMMLATGKAVRPKG